MLKSYKAIYNHGSIVWIDGPPQGECVPLLIVADERSTGTADDASPANATENGDILVALIEQMTPETKNALTDKFGDPCSWQRKQRRERHQPGRNQK